MYQIITRVLFCCCFIHVSFGFGGIHKFHFDQNMSRILVPMLKTKTSYTGGRNVIKHIAIAQMMSK